MSKVTNNIETFILWRDSMRELTIPGLRIDDWGVNIGRSVKGLGWLQAVCGDVDADDQRILSVHGEIVLSKEEAGFLHTELAVIVARRPGNSKQFAERLVSGVYPKGITMLFEASLTPGTATQFFQILAPYCLTPLNRDY